MINQFKFVAGLLLALTVLGLSSCGNQNEVAGSGDIEVTSVVQESDQEQDKDSSEGEHKNHQDDLLDENGEPKYTNSLIDETSPYLLQHAHNPVQWYPWNEATLKKAKDENKLIFLSIGYSSCHWCHVMEHESFMDEEIAKFMNENFVCIKVDREERPDVDTVYMESLHVVNRVMQTGAGGGWPLSMFMLPDARPFFGGTYFPARTGDRGNRTGFKEILEMLDKVWKDTPGQLESDAKIITELTQKSLKANTAEVEKKVKANWRKYALVDLRERFDPTWGGFRYSPTNDRVPKFPEETKLLILVDALQRNPDDASAKEMMITTADRMMMGGIHDHVGGGFHRYSVDRYWRIPHYEKMLYNNGQLTSFYSEAFKLTGDPAYRKVVEDMLEFVEREMLASDGGYYAALDADSEGEEGKFYVWDREEMQRLLSDKEYQLYASVFGINGAPNFEEKYYSPVLSQTWKDTAAAQNMSVRELWFHLKPINQKLFEARAKRIRPGTDSKVLTSWNGLMIRGLADAGRLLDNEIYIQRATKAANFVLEKLQQDDGRLLRTYTAGQAKLNAYLDDYAFMIDGLIALHKATGEAAWLEKADRLLQKQIELFHDSDGGGFYFTSNDHQELLAKTKDPVDAAIPSGNGVTASNLLYLGKKLEKPEYEEMAKGIYYATSGLLERVPIAAARLLESLPEFADE
jgi:uncharacterized protein YyaL (SSP411 family)